MLATERARLSLEGLSVGDAFGERFMGPPHRVKSFIARRAEPGGVWRWTDDTAMAISIVDQLEETATIDQAEALWQTVSAFGDHDTTCAIVGGITALQVGGIPATWRRARERLPLRL